MMDTLAYKVKELEKSVKKIEAQDVIIQAQDVKIKALVVKIEEKDVQNKAQDRILKFLIDREKRVSVREAARILEHHICLSASSSITKARRDLFSFKKFDQSDQKEVLDQTLQSLGLTREVIKRLKECGPLAS